MRWTLSAVLIGLLAAIGSSVPLVSTAGPHQEVFSPRGSRCASVSPYQLQTNDDSGIMYLPPNEDQASWTLANEQMQGVIDQEMQVKYDAEKYREAFMSRMCKSKEGYIYSVCNVTVLREPKIQVISVWPISKHIVCPVSECSYVQKVSHTISTNHVGSFDFSVEVGAEPFRQGLEFTTSPEYDFGPATEDATELSYEFKLGSGKYGYVAITGAQVSSKVRVDTCLCKLEEDGTVESECSAECEDETNWTRETEFHEANIPHNALDNSCGPDRSSGRSREHQTSGEDLNDQMQDIIDDEMGYRYYPEKYRVALMEDLCKPKLGFRNLVCNVTILEDPTIEIIPAQPISQLIYCSTPTCRVSYSVTQTVSTTHSNSIGFSGSAGATPFGVGMQFTASTGYEFSSTTEKATELGYEFQINRGESGYVAIVGVQVSARARFESCPCELQGDGRVSWKCKIKCRSEENWTRKEGYHESIIKQNGGVKGIVSFIYT
ncbi:hypothetical protein BGZ91_002975 [Linnemannia elongata]|nr:hypothetical protein BGZ91_002975 [Linnemannia elongata]